MNKWDNKILFTETKPNFDREKPPWLPEKSGKFCKVEKCKYYPTNEDDEFEARDRIINRNCLECEHFMEEL